MVVGVVEEAGVETIMLAGQRGTGAGRTNGAAGTGTGVWRGGEGRMGIGACMGRTIGAGCVGAGPPHRLKLWVQVPHPSRYPVIVFGAVLV